MTISEKQCPYCKEIIRLDAIKCRFCQSVLTNTQEGNLAVDHAGQGENDTPPINVATLPHGYVVCLVLVPILGSILDVVMADLISSSSETLSFESVYSNPLWFLLYAFLNGLLCHSDSQALAKIGIRVSWGWGVVLVPVYLYSRGNAINRVYETGWFNTQVGFVMWIGSLFVGMFLSYYLLSLY